MPSPKSAKNVVSVSTETTEDQQRKEVVEAIITLTKYPEITPISIYEACRTEVAWLAMCSKWQENPNTVRIVLPALLTSSPNLRDRQQELYYSSLARSVGVQA